jgi:hypothetical protein
MKVGFAFGDSMAARMQPPFNDPVIWNFAIPFAAAALLVAMLVDTQLAFLTGIITALFAGMLAPGGMQKRCSRWFRVLPPSTALDVIASASQSRSRVCWSALSTS